MEIAVKETIVKVLDAGWRLKNEERKIELEARVPGSVYDELMDHGMIPDPFFGVNEHEVGWVHESTWIYTLEFTVGETVMNRMVQVLSFHGIDTVASISLNGEHIASVDNMFLRHDVDVTGKIHRGINTLEISIASPTLEAKRLMKKHRQLLKTFSGIGGAPYLRKAQYSFGWDWGPQLPDSSIWQPVKLIARDGVSIVSIQDMQSFQYSADPFLADVSSLEVKSVNLDLKVEVKVERELPVVRKSSLQVAVETPSGKRLLQEQEVTLSKGTRTITFSFMLDDPTLWWCHDLGEPMLHEVTVALESRNVIVEKCTRAIGIREIRLVRQPDDWGESFFFMLNGVPVFAKGANWIPVDSFIPRGKRNGLYQRNLLDAKNAGMNMIRVWGGGIYEDELFYDTCDKHGILVWQDFPFACAMYPAHDGFVENVRQEAGWNIKRLRHHACLALWCGNNEVEQLWKAYLATCRLIFKPWKIRRYRKAYKRIFEKMLPELVHELDPARAYWPSSPSNGGGNRKRGLIKSNSPDTGDSHFWKVWHMGAPFSAYRAFYSRFMSEFGFESFPSMATIRSFCPHDQLDFFSPVMENHQKNKAGNKKIMRYMKRRFSIPSKFDKQVILSQITQAEAMEYGIEHWHRNRNQYHCMGSLFWQLNDCWPVASWSSLDYHGRWKALHYYAKRFYQSVTASIAEFNDHLEIWVVNDTRKSFNARVEWCIVEPATGILESGTGRVPIPPCTAKCSREIHPKDIEGWDHEGFEGIIAFYRVHDADNQDAIVHQAFRVIGKPKDLKLSDPHLQVEVLEDEVVLGGTHVDAPVMVNTNNVAIHVHIVLPGIDFIASDNFFGMEPGTSRKITLSIQLDDSMDAHEHINEIKTKIEVHSLVDLTGGK
ncbi:hypothetical protein GF325_10355 [Candidatus Bathyarchaeota archaeon]|nr:hypothetical protein [Candidatus Bathyarchaeota archaeon]